MIYYVIMGNATDYCEVMCGDVRGRENVLFVNQTNHFQSEFFNSLDLFLQKVSQKPILTFLPSIRFKKYFSGVSIPEKENICFILFDSNHAARDAKFLKFIRRKYRAKLVLYAMNPTSAIELSPALCRECYDMVFTTYANDADRYGWQFYNHLYSIIPEDKPITPDHLTPDVFFIGRAKSRLQKILATYEYLAMHDIHCDFHIVEVKEKEMRHAGSIHYNQWLPYREVLQRVRRSRCLLEILQKPGEGPTLRTIEAIVYNKKIITNDAGAARNPCYNSRFVHVFDVPEAISPSFVKENTVPKYDYRGEYSAIHFLKRIEDILFNNDPLPRKPDMENHGQFSKN